MKHTHYTCNCCGKGTSLSELYDKPDYSDFHLCKRCVESLLEAHRLPSEPKVGEVDLLINDNKVAMLRLQACPKGVFIRCRDTEDPNQTMWWIGVIGSNGKFSRPTTIPSFLGFDTDAKRRIVIDKVDN